jgi:aminoglycoside phosphotransferase (APT) family kinase protein
MECMDEVHADSNLVRLLIREQFPQWAGLSVEQVAVNGWDNSTLRLGTELSVRLPTAERYVPQVTKEHRWLPVLAPHLPLEIPDSIALGAPGAGYPWPWSVRRWIPGSTGSTAEVFDLARTATRLAGFLTALESVDTKDGPPAGEHSFSRGGPLSSYDDEVRAAARELDGVRGRAVIRLWNTAVTTEWRHPPVWVHGDMTASNLLVREGELEAVIDFGAMSVGDPSCDLVIAWTLFEGASRRVFMAELPSDEETWLRARGWLLWKALVTMATASDERDAEASARRYGWRQSPRDVVGDVLNC